MVVIIFEYIHGKVDKNENIELESDDDIRFYPVNNVPFNISDYDDIEDLTSSLHDLSIQNANYQLLIQKEWIIQRPNILTKVKSKIIYFNPD